MRARSCCHGSNPRTTRSPGIRYCAAQTPATWSSSKDDTGSSSTSYTDTAPPAGQTHTYGVKARNSAGLSPAGTATATVPAAEVLIVARHEDSGNTLVSNLGQTAAGDGGGIVGSSHGNLYEIATSFTTGNNPHGYHPTSVQLYMNKPVGGDTPTPRISIRGDNAGLPGETALYTLNTSTRITTSHQLITFTTSDGVALQPNTKYWLYINATGGTATAQETASDDEDTESNVNWQIGDDRVFRENGGTWTTATASSLRMAIHGHAAPAFLVSNLDSPGENLLFFRETDTDTSKLAQSFSAADNTDGTTAEFDFHGVTVLLELGVFLGSQLADSDILATVHRDNGGQPGDLVHTLTAPATYTVLRDSGPITFSASPGSTLSSGITYWVKFEIATDSTFFTGPTSIYFEFATDNNEVQGPTTNNRWTIGHDSLWSPETLAWTTEVRSIKMSVLGTPRYDTLVSNIDQTFLGAEPTGPDVKAAQSFLTPPGPLGQQYRLNAARFNASSQHPTHAMIDLHADDNGVPGDHLASMTMPGNFAPGDTVVADLTVSAPKNTNLNPGTRYWFVFNNEQLNNPLYLRVTESKAQDSTSLNGWTIGDRRAKKEADQPWSSVAFPIQIEVLGSAPFFRTDELAPLLVSNLGQSTGTLISADYDERTAQAFVAGPSRVGFDYRFQGIRVSASGVSTFNQFRMPQVRASLHRDGGGIPGARLHTLTMPDDFASTVEYEDYTLSAPPGTVLRGGARYWVVFEVLDHTLYLEGTSSADEDPRLDAWSIDNYSYIKRASGGWVRVARVTDVIPRIIKLAVLGSPLWVTDEADGPDLPGAGHNAHETNGVVMPGIVSTGHLTPGLDYDHGHSGDYWWLDTQWGHSYRIEVKFGASPNTATGGSAWTYFIDGDRRGTCCDSDHNRNDGYTVLHIKHDQNRKYLINVAVFDKLNSGSQNFNGPYTITMTDITGTDKPASNLYHGTLAQATNFAGSRRQYAVDFTTGQNPGGYKLDRVRTHIPNDHSAPVLTLHVNTSSAPGAKACDFRNPTQVQHLVYWEDFPAPIPFLAPDCADVILTANTRYWIVFAGRGYQPVLTDSDDQLTNRSGWFIGNVAATKTASPWSDLADGSTIPVEIWASKR